MVKICHRHVKRKQQQKRGECQYPPTIPLLARTWNLPAHMPWILTRHYYNGRLVLKEKKVKHHEYFEAVRENGRFILHHVPLDDTFACCHAVCEPNEDEEEVELENVGFCQGDDYLEKVIEDPDDYEDEEEEEEDGYQGQTINISSAFHSVPKFWHGNERYRDPRKCLTYSGRIISESTSMFSNGAAGHEQQEGNATSSLAFCNVVPSDLACLVN